MISSLNKIKSLLKIDIIVMLCMYALMYIFTLGAYDAEQFDYVRDGNPEFIYRRVIILTLVGLGTSLSFIIFYIIRNAKKKKFINYIFPLEIIHIIVVCFGFYSIFRLAIGVSNYYSEDKLPVYMMGIGVVAYIMIGIANIIAIFATLMGLIYSIKYKIDKENELPVKKIPKLHSDIEYYRERVSILNGWIFAVLDVVLICIAILSCAVMGPIFGTIPMIVGVVMPLVLYQCIFCVNWINNGKWLGVILTYLMLIYFAYSMMFFTLEWHIDVTLELFSLDKTGVFIVISCIFIVIALGMSVCGVMDRIKIKTLMAK